MAGNGVTGRLKGLLLACIAVAASVCLLGPWMVYEYALAKIDTLPAPPPIMLSDAERRKLWQKLRIAGEPPIKPIGPVAYTAKMIWLMNFATGDAAELLDLHEQLMPGYRAASWAARAYLLEHRADPHHYDPDWHLKNMALTLWFTQHWGTEEILELARKGWLIEQESRAHGIFH